MNKNVAFVITVLLFASVAFAASNYVQPGDNLVLTWSTTSPTLNDAVVKGTSKAAGCIVGVALTGGATAGENVTVATKGVFYLPIVASSTVGNMAIGDYVFASVAGDVQVCTTTLSNINSGVIFGQLLEAVTASTTAGVSSTVKVKLLQPSHL
jgi:predicted RecA/RadA family phage recombinase